MRLLIANHCPFLLSLAISFFYFTLPSKKVKCFLEELYISYISNKNMANCCVSSQRLSCRRVTTFQKIGFSEISCLKSPSKFQIRTENAPADLPTSAFILFGGSTPEFSAGLAGHHSYHIYTNEAVSRRVVRCCFKLLLILLLHHRLDLQRQTSHLMNRQLLKLLHAQLV